MKKFAFASLVAVASLSLAACGEPAEDDAATEDEQTATPGGNGDPDGPRPVRD